MATISILRDVASHNFDLDSEKVTVRKVSIFTHKKFRFNFSKFDTIINVS